MKDEKIDNLRNEVEMFYGHYLYLCDLIAVYNHMDQVSRERNGMAVNFFRIAKRACIDAMMNFARLYDSSKSAKTIPRLLNNCLKNISFFDDKELAKEKIDEFIQIIKDKEDDDKDRSNEELKELYIREAIKIIRERRDKIFAHNDKKYFIDQSKDKSHLKYYKLWCLRDYTGQVINFFLNELKIETKNKNVYNRDLEQLI